MGLRFKYWLSTGLSGILMVLIIANIWLYLGNLDRQQEVNNRQALIQQIQQVDLPLYRELTQALVDLARRGDNQIGYLLAGEKITIAPAPSLGGQQVAGQAPPQSTTPAPTEPTTAESAKPGRTKGKSQTPATPPVSPN